jgi:hypothetical protein
MDVLASVRQPSTFRMLIWPEASNAQNSIAAVSADGSTVLDKLSPASSHTWTRNAKLVQVFTAPPRRALP